MTAWLLTWLWQGIAITLAALLVARLRPLNGATRYAIWWCAGITVAALAVVPHLSHLPHLSLLPHLSHPSHLPHPSHVFVVPSAPPVFFSVLFGVWTAVVLMRLIRLVPAIGAINALRDRCRPFPADVEQRLPLWIEARGHGRRTSLAVCDAVPGPAVLGFFDPRIVLPTSMLASLTVEELDQVILHEYGHAQRWDDWMRLVQELFHAALWIHPVTMVIARQLDRHREIACDEWVVARTGLPAAYARCLARAAEVRSRIGGSTIGGGVALGPALFARRRDLVGRIDRLLAINGRTRRKMSPLGVTAGASALVALAVQLHGLPLVTEVGELLLPSIAERRSSLGEGPLAVAYAPGSPSNPPPSSAGRVRPQTKQPERENADAVRRTAAAIEDSPSSSTLLQIAERHAAHDDRATLQARAIRSQRPFAPPTLVSVAVPVDDATPWEKAASAGVRLGESFARAGVSIARRF